MSNYKILLNEGELIRFIHDVLPDLGQDEQFYFSLFARKKYDNSVQSSDRADLARFLCYKDQIVDKIKQLEVPLGAYVSKGYVLPNESLALYMHPNPRNLRKASWNLIRELTVRLENEKQKFNPHNLAMTTCHKSKGKTHFVDFDLDLENKADIPQIIADMKDIVGNSCVFIETRGGLHCLIRPDLANGQVTVNKNWHQEIMTNFEIDQSGDLLLPVPGCTQGGFTPKNG